MIQRLIEKKQITIHNSSTQGLEVRGLLAFRLGRLPLQRHAACLELCLASCHRRHPRISQTLHRRSRRRKQHLPANL